MARPVLLDLFCKAGGAGMGYHRAGFDVVGVDIEPQKRYPFDFLQADALTVSLAGYDAIHASPPCQLYSITHARAGRPERPDLVPAVRHRLAAAGVPYVIENVIGAPLVHAVCLDGGMFGLRVIRRRLFESNIYLMTPRPAFRPLNAGLECVAGNGSGVGCRDRWRRAMGIDWMTRAELAQAIPPAYTEYLGRQLIRAVRQKAA